MDLNTFFGLPLSDLQLLKSMNPEQLKAAGIDLEEIEKAISENMDMMKGGREGLVQKEVQVQGKHGVYTKKVWVKADKAKSSEPKPAKGKKEPAGKQAATNDSGTHTKQTIKKLSDAELESHANDVFKEAENATTTSAKVEAGDKFNLLKKEYERRFGAYSGPVNKLKNKMVSLESERERKSK